MFEADADTQRMIDWAAAAGLPQLNTLSPDAARAQSAAGTAKIALDLEAVAKIENRTIEGSGGDLKVRLYYPLDASEEPLPIGLYYHGGGFVIGSIDTHDSIPRVLANRSGAIIVSVDYRLAPECRYPAAVDDAESAVLWAWKHGASFGGDPSRLAVVGDSAGGNLAAVAALRVRKPVDKALVAQALLYPVTDHATLSRHQSRLDHADTFPIREPLMAWFHNHYFGHDEPMGEPDASPLHHPDLSNSAPAYVMTAGLDPLMDEGKAYADALSNAGVDVEYSCWETTIHGFLQMGKVIPAAADALAEAADFLKRRFNV
ncbi:MAG: alpha/beta hydrolase [Pseudomonadota bacterium]|nr:alpha/beta hydrolase [Pseudomonadota bacterium]